MRPATVALCMLLAGCASGPGPALFVLGRAPAPANSATRQSGLPILEVKPVQLPGYLDTTDLVVRGAGGQIIPSRAGRWGERLSEGFTRALTADLVALLPYMAVTSAPPVERPVRQLLVDVANFEARLQGPVVLRARWTFTDGAARQTFSSELVSITVPVRGTGDGAVATAMTEAIDDLAARIASSLGGRTG